MKETKKKIKMYRSISKIELSKMLLGIPIDGKYSPLHVPECGNNGYYGNILCAFEEKIKWNDKHHDLMITIEVPEERILGKGESVWWLPKSFAKTKTYCGKRGNEKWILNEYYLKQYSILDVVDISFFEEFPHENYQILRTLIFALGYLEFKSTYLLLENYSDEDVIKKVEELISKFPETNTLIPKKEYEKALWSLLEKAFEFKKNKKKEVA